ncbi:MAG: bifunctional adenosylcobinamide kinase/adenosylcobinamide-phosphate guanylyltransferase [Streptosporangiaceae bacterium]
MEIVIEASAGPRGWPEQDCRCASCSRLRTAGTAHAPTRIRVDGVPLEALTPREVQGGFDVLAPSGGRLLVAAGAGAMPEPVAGTGYDAVFLDLIGRPEHLGHLRRIGAVRTGTQVHAVHVDHRVASERELERRLALWLRPPTGPHRTLLLGGSRSGKSAEAELRLIAHPQVTYAATGPLPAEADPEWAARVHTHQGRRPSWWRTLETVEVAEALRTETGALLVDGFGTWVAAVMDRCRAWEEPAAVRPWFDDLVQAWRGTRATVVAVSDEVGLSLVPTTTSGRLFRDLLGELNQRLAAESEETALIVAGRILS